VIGILAVLVAVGAPALAAQDSTQDRAAQARERFEQMKDRLQLTPEQVEKVRPVLLDEARQLQALRDEYRDGGGRGARRKLAREARSIQSRTDDQLKTILSKSQMDEVKKIREERRQELRKRSGRN
jgi:hypothetical protein